MGVSGCCELGKREGRAREGWGLTASESSDCDGVEGALLGDNLGDELLPLDFIPLTKHHRIVIALRLALRI